MFRHLLSALILVLPSVSGDAGAIGAEDLPQWIAKNPGFLHPTELDCTKTGNGLVSEGGNGDKGWLVSLNEKSGHGAEIDVEELVLNQEKDDFLLISTWPLAVANFKQIKLYTGQFKKPLRKLRIPNSKVFFLLYSASNSTTLKPSVQLSFRRYGSSLEPNEFTTENPVKKKDIVLEIQLKGKAPEEYTNLEFLSRLKEGIRAAAQRYATANNISFNHGTPTEEMVRFHKITACPFEWPDRDICASLKHSVFISGTPVPDEGIILNYQLTADHLKVMWSKDPLTELHELGVVVFQLPLGSSTVGYWCLISLFVITSSLIISCIIWKANKPRDASFDEDSTTTTEEVNIAKRPKYFLSKHQRLPSFILKNPHDAQLDKYREPGLRSSAEENFEDVLKPGLPMKNFALTMSTAIEVDETLALALTMSTTVEVDETLAHFGSILFGPNRAFEEDDEKTTEPPQKSPLVK